MPVDKFGRDLSEGYVSDAGVSVRYINNNFLRKDGSGTATGPLDMGKNRISNVVDPIDEQDVATKHYVDRPMQGAMNMGGNRIMSLGSPQRDDDAATRRFVAQLDQQTLNTALGMFMTVDGTTRPVADISWGGRALKDLTDPVDDADAVNKMYVDEQTQNVLLRTGDMMSGILNMKGNRITNLPSTQPLHETDAATKGYVDFASRATTSLLGGKTISVEGPARDVPWNDKKILNLGDPEDGKDAATKRYVDGRAQAVAAYMKSMVGYIPSLTTSNDYAGFKADASSYYTNGQSRYYPFHAFNMDGGMEWVTRGETRNFWLSIKCPQRVRVWQILLTGRYFGEELIRGWRFEGSNDNESWVTLLQPPYPTVLGIHPQLFSIPFSTTPYQYYRIYVTDAQTTNPGIGYMQLYVYDEVTVRF